MEDTIDAAIDTELGIEENSVPQTTAANPDGGAAKLDADPISVDLDQSIDNLLDEAERETTQNPDTQPEQTKESIADPVAAPADQTPTDNSKGTDVNINPAAAEPAGTQVPIDPEIAAIEQPRNLSEKNQSNWRKLQETATTYKQQAAELQQQVEQLSQQKVESQAPEDYQQLKEFRAIFEVKNDPDFKNQFDVPLSQAHENIYSIMKSHGASDDVIQQIKQHGGPEKIDQQWWKQNAIDRLPLAESEKLKKSLLDCYDITERRKQEIDFVENHAREIVEMKEAYDREYSQTEETLAYEYADKMTLANKAEWARYKEIPAGATQAQIEQINKHNADVDGYKEKFFSALRPSNTEEKVAVAAAAVLSHRLVAELEKEQSVRAELQNAIKKLYDENSRLKGASKMPRQSVSTIAQNKTASLNDRIKMSASDAIDIGLDEAGE